MGMGAGNDRRVLPGGTAYVSDLGMCGDYDSET